MPLYQPAAGATVADSAVTFTDITTGNSGTGQHGFLKKLSNTSTDFMNGQGNWATPSGSGASVATVDATLSADVTMTTANTFYDGPSASFAAGTWLIQWQMLFKTAGTSVHQYTTKLWDGTTVYGEAEQDSPSTANAHGICAKGVAIVTLGSTTTLKVSGTDAISGSQTMLRDPAANSAASHTATRMVGYKVT